MERPSRAQYTKCSKKNPLTCRLHAGQYRKFQKAMTAFQTSERNSEEQALIARIQEDIKTNFKLKKLPDGTYEASVYRVGVPNPPSERKVEAESYTQADKLIPEGRQGRNTAVFATPVLGTVGRWAGDLNPSVDQQVRELRVNPDEVYVYSVHAWERTHYYGEFTERDAQKIKEYWATGVTLSQWIREANKGHILDPGEWEILVPEKSIRKVSFPTIPKIISTQYLDWRNDELEKWLKRNRKEMKLVEQQSAVA